MTVALVFPPTCDPTAPYVSVPLLTGWLRAHGLEVLPVDANIGSCDYLLRPSVLASLRARVEERYRDLNRRPTLPHSLQGVYLALWDCLAESADLPETIDSALAVLRGLEPGFYDPATYARSVDTVERGLRLAGASCAPLELSFSAYRSPFSLLDPRERLADSRPDRNPYHEYFATVLLPALLERRVDIVGISVAFPGQIQPAYSLAHILKECPEAHGIHLTVGGPAMTQILGRLEGELLERALVPFDTAILYEGEEALLALTHDVGAGGPPRGLVRGTRIGDLERLPAPDFEGLDLGRYLSPEPVLPYDLSRGCPWGRCAFCHYGLADSGTAPYRERSPATATKHLRGMRERHGARLIYLSEDSVRPPSLLSLSEALRQAGAGVRWSTDVRPEGLLADEKAVASLRDGGALSFSFGVESGSDRVLRLIDKGIELETARKAVRATARAGIAAEVMLFTDFPTESAEEAMQTLALLEELRESIALFMCGTFGLTAGSAVAREPGRFGIGEVWTVRGDELGLVLHFAQAGRRPWKTTREQSRIDDAIGALSRSWRLASYPWAGSLSTAHTMLWYDHSGPDVFRRLSRLGATRGRRRPPCERPRYDRDELAERFDRNEARIWDSMVRGERAVSRARYEELASRSRGSATRGAGQPGAGADPGSRQPAPRRR